MPCSSVTAHSTYVMDRSVAVRSSEESGIQIDIAPRYTGDEAGNEHISAKPVARYNFVTPPCS
jgi:hypothetical protein